MKKIDIVSTKKSPSALGPYSQAVKVGEMVYVSGQVGLNPVSGNIENEEVEEQAKQALTNIKYILEEAGSSLDNVVKVTIFLTSMEDYGKVNKVYGDFFKKTYPSRCCLEVSRLPGNAKVEIDAISLVN